MGFYEKEDSSDEENEKEPDNDAISMKSNVS
jgi:hypothetical protein